MVEYVVCQVKADVDIVRHGVGADNQRANNYWYAGLNQCVIAINVNCPDRAWRTQAVMDAVEVFPQIRDFMLDAMPPVQEEVRYKCQQDNINAELLPFGEHLGMLWDYHWKHQPIEDTSH